MTADVGDRRALLGNTPFTDPLTGLEIAGDGYAGLLARPGDVESLAGTILQALRNPELASALRQAGLRRIKTFTWERMAERVEALYQT